MTTSLYKKFKGSAEHSLERRRLFKLLKELQRISDILIETNLLPLYAHRMTDSNRAASEAVMNISTLNAKFVTDELSEFKILYNKTIDILNTGLTELNKNEFDIPEKIEEDLTSTDRERRRKIINKVYEELGVELPKELQANQPAKKAFSRPLPAPG